MLPSYDHGVREGRVRLWARVGVAAQVVFVLAWIVAGFWQGPGYSTLKHSISDMYAVTAPRGLFLVVVITLCGIGTALFAVLSVWPTLRPSGWRAAVGSILLGVSIYGLGDALTPFERETCRLADPGCTGADQLSNAGGVLDAVLSLVGLVCFVVAGFFLAAAMKRVPGWQSMAWPARWVAITSFALLVISVAAEAVGGLLQRVLAAFGAAAIAALALRILAPNHDRRSGRAQMAASG